MRLITLISWIKIWQKLAITLIDAINFTYKKGGFCQYVKSDIVSLITVK